MYRIFWGKYFFSFSVVTHNSHLVFLTSSRYFIESKNVISFFLAKIRGFISLIIKFFEIFKSGKILLILTFFFLKKKFDPIQI